ncbi:hypothetical protein GOP47_0027335 [Adiantum capillus-veneris]|nr:hypothetical protein GOP47_0027335 [Adiantum capillus-veneris]
MKEAHLPAQLQQCRLYSRPRGPLWRGMKGIGKEALHVLGEVKRTKSDKIELGNSFQHKVARLLKMDLLAVLQELQRQNEVDLAMRVFNVIRKEFWYKPDIYLYKDMLHCLARNKRVHDCERLLKDFKVEGLPPDGLLLTEVMTAYLECGMLPQAMETFDEMRKGSIPPDAPAFKVLLKFLKRMGKKELRSKIRSEYMEFYEGVIESKHRKRKEESDEEEAEMEWHQKMKLEESDEEMELERHHRFEYAESDEKEEEMVRHQKSKLAESDEEEWEMECEDEEEVERHQRAKKRAEHGEKEEEMARHQRSRHVESDEEEWGTEEYEESDKEEVETGRHQRAKHEESNEKEEDRGSDQRSSHVESDEEWETEEYEDSDEEEVEIERH